MSGGRPSVAEALQAQDRQLPVSYRIWLPPRPVLLLSEPAHLPAKSYSFMLGYASLVAQTVKRLSAMQGTWVRSLAWEDPLEKKMAAHSSTLAWKIPWT